MLLFDRLPTQVKLCQRGVINGSHNIVCPLCFDDENLVVQLFLLCRVSSHIWSASLNWTGFSGLPQFVLMVDNFIFLDNLVGCD